MLSILTLVDDAQTQISNKELPRYEVQLQLPWHGPGAALHNPAELAGNHFAFLQAGLFTSVGGKGAVQSYQTSAATKDILPVTFAAGIGGFRDGFAFDGSHAENRFHAVDLDQPGKLFGGACRVSDHRAGEGGGAASFRPERLAFLGI